jgi:exodeoxyribonuclease V alpha subunit
MEVPCVVLALDDSHFTLLERQLVYTGVTRAKKLLVIVGSKRALAIAAKRAQTKKRGTMLRERITRLVDPSQRYSLSLDFSE